MVGMVRWKTLGLPDLPDGFCSERLHDTTVSYRLKRDSIYPAAVEDVRDAVQWLFANGENFGYDPSRIALIGGSAGGHLTLLTGYGWGKEKTVKNSSGVSENRRRIKAVVDIYGPVDLTSGYAQTQPLVTGFIGHSFEERPDLYKEAPINYLKAVLPLILHGTSDLLVPVSESICSNKNDALGVPANTTAFPLAACHGHSQTRKPVHATKNEMFLRGICDIH